MKHFWDQVGVQTPAEQCEIRIINGYKPIYNFVVLVNESVNENTLFFNRFGYPAMLFH